MPDLDVIPGRGGRWLVRDGRRAFTVPETLGRELARDPTDSRTKWHALVGEADRRGRLSPLWLRIVLMPAAQVDRYASRLSGAAGWRAMAFLAALGAGGAAVAAATGPAASAATATDVLAGVAWFLLTAYWHELGHAAALRREGLPAGPIGLALLWVVPVLTCDVTSATLLARRGRARVDLAGLVFQLGAGGALAAAAAVTHSPPLRLGAAGAFAAVVWSAMPLLRTDGHWLLLDLFGLPDLDAPPPPRWRAWSYRSRRAGLGALTIWRLVTAIALVAMAIWVPARVDSWMIQLAGRGLPSIMANGLRGGVFLVCAAGAWRALVRVRALLRAAGRDLRVR